MDTANIELQLFPPTVDVTATPRGANIRFSIVESSLFCAEDEVESWHRCRKQWRYSDQSDDAAWQKYRHVVESGRYHFVARKGDAKYGFAEAYVALALLHKGYSFVWTGAYLFHPPPKNAGIRRDNSLAINDRSRNSTCLLTNSSASFVKSPLTSIWPRTIPTGTDGAFVTQSEKRLSKRSRSPGWLFCGF